MKKTYRYDPATRKLVEVVRVRRAPKAPAIIGDIEPFVSPVDGRTITSRRDLRVHKEEHGIAELREYGDNDGAAHFERAQQERVNRMAGATPEDKRDRIEKIIPIVEANES